MSGIPVLMLFLLLAVTMETIWSEEQGWNRQHLTEELQKLAVKVEQLDKAHLSEAIFRLGETIGQKLTVGLQDLGKVLTTNSCQPDQGPDSTKPASCVDVKKYDKSNSVHTLTVNTRQIRVFCDQETAGGGWTVIQRRRDGSVDFYRDWAEYVSGFGDLEGEFWLGLENIYQLTSAQNQILRVDMQDFNGSTAYAEYRRFSLGGPENLYQLHVSGFSGTAGDSLDYHNGKPFSTFDRDNDDRPAGNCAAFYLGAWWYRTCHHSNLNGKYKQKDEDASDAKGVDWTRWRERYISLKRVEMKIKPVV